MALLKLNGTWRPRSIVAGSLSINYDDAGGGSASLTTLGVKAEAGQSVELWTNDQTELLWGGLVETPKEAQEGHGEGSILSYAVTIGSFRKLARRRLAIERYVSRKAGEIVRDLCSKYAPQLDTSLVEDGPAVAEWTCNYSYPDDEIADLAKAIGFAYDVDPQLRVVFKPLADYAAPFSLTEGSRNFEGLTITVDKSQLRNSVIVRGGKMAGPLFTETFIGDGIRANFQLLQEPFQAGSGILLNELFDGDINATTWTETDTIDNFMQVYEGSLQTTGGPGEWGEVAMVSKLLYDRKADRRLEEDVKALILSEFAIGWHDGEGQTLTDIVHGILFKVDGTLAAVLEGAEVALSGKTYVTETDYRVRLLLGTAGTTLQIQGGSYGEWGTPNWTTLHTTESGSQPYLAVTPLTHKSGQVIIDNVVVRDPAKGVTVEVDGIPKVVGIENVDEGSGVDCIIAAQARMIRFFSENRPASGAQVVVKYHQPIPVIAMVSDPASVSKMAAIEGGEGIYEYAMPPDPTIESLDAARAAGRSELDQYGNPEITAEYRTLHAGLRPGMVQSFNVRGLTQDFKIRSVTAQEVGYDTDGSMATEYAVTAGSRLRGIEDYLQELIRHGKRVQRSEGEVIDVLGAPIEFVPLLEDPKVIVAPRYPDEVLDFSENPSVTTAPRYPDEALSISDSAATQLLTEGIGPDLFGTMRFGYIILD